MDFIKRIVFCAICVSTIVAFAASVTATSGYFTVSTGGITLYASDGTVPGGIAVNWTDINREQYELFRGDAKEGPFNRIAVVSTNSYFDSSVEWGHPYWYYVHCSSMALDSNVDEGLGKSNAELPQIKEVKVAELWLVGKGPYNIQICWNDFDIERYLVDHITFKVSDTDLEYVWCTPSFQMTQALIMNFDLSTNERTIGNGLHGRHDITISYLIYDKVSECFIPYDNLRVPKRFSLERPVEVKVFFEKWKQVSGIANWFRYWPKNGAISHADMFSKYPFNGAPRDNKIHYCSEYLVDLADGRQGINSGGFVPPKSAYKHIVHKSGLGIPDSLPDLYELTGDTKGLIKATDAGAAKGGVLRTLQGSVGRERVGVQKLEDMIAHEKKHQELFNEVANHPGWFIAEKGRINGQRVTTTALPDKARLLKIVESFSDLINDDYCEALTNAINNNRFIIDSDGDGLSNDYEDENGFDKFDSDSRGLASMNGQDHYLSYGDNEVLARKEESAQHSVTCDTTKDWAFPGAQVAQEYQGLLPHEWACVSSSVTQSLQTLGSVGKSIGVSRTSEDVDNVNASGGVLDFMPEYILSDARGVVSLTHCSEGWAEWNTNGLISAIKYAIAVTNMTDGDIPCVVRGYLSTSNDLPVAWAEYHCEVAGNHLLEGELSFPGEAIYSKNVEDFRLRYIVIEAFGDVMPDLYDSCITNIGTDLIYAHSQYERKPGYIFYDKMVSRVEGGNVTISVPVEINAGGEFTLKGVLENSNGVFVASACTTGCTNGISEAMLEFKGEDIYRSGQNSPYVLAEIQLISPNNVVVDGKWDAIAIETLTYSQFRPAGSVVEIDTESFVHIGNSLDDQSQLKEKLSFSFECSNTASTDLGYELMATLTGTNGVAVTKCFNRLNLQPGKNNISLTFVGGTIRESAVDGPYYVSEVFLEPIGGVGIRERFVPVHSPIDLRASDFGGVPFAVKGTPQYRETDGVNSVAVAVTVDVARPDTITASALLVDGNGRYVATAMTSEAVAEVGEKTLTLSFDLNEVNASGRRGPYTISYLLLKSGIDGVEDIRIEDFEVKNVGDSSLTVFVDAANGNDENDGLIFTSAKRTISAAIDVASDGDKIMVADGTYEPFICTNQQITIQSVNGPRYTIIDGGGTNRCATLGTDAGHTNTILRGFTLRNGNANGNAVTIARNYGGGAYCGTIEVCRIYGNTASYGGGISYSKVSDSLISGNSAINQGGAVYLARQGCVQRIERCSICQNSSSGSPVEIIGNGEPVVVDGCLIAENFYRSWLAVNDESGDQRVTITNTTIVGNSSLPSNTSGVGYANVVDSIVWNNFSRPGRLANYSSSFFQNSCTYPLPSGSSNIAADPQFVDEAHHVYHLKPGSPCIGAATDGGAIGAAGVAPEGGFTVGTETDGYGLILEPGTVVEQGGSATFTAVEIGREFLHFKTNGVFATTDRVIELANIQSDILVTAVFVKRELFVDAANGNDGNNGLSWMMAKKSISSAINATLDYDSIFVTNGVYGPITPSWKKILIQSANGAADTIIDGGGSSQCVNCLENGSGITNAVIVGFTLRNGFSTYYGGGAIGGVLRDCVIIDCEATTYGGGTCNSHLENCVIARNKAGTYGGGTYYGVAVHCTICGNEAVASGGGTYSGTLYNCIISKNVVGGNEANWVSGTFASCCTYPNRGSNPIVGDPLLVDGWNGDARLRVGSPCIVDGVQICGAYMGEPLEGISVSVGVKGTGSVSNNTMIVTSGGSATIEAVETVRPFLYWNINGEQITNQVFMITNITSDIRAVAVFGTFDWYVDAEYGDDANDGREWVGAKRTLQTAIEAAVDGETIYVEAGTYEPIVTKNKRIRIESMNGAEMTFIDGGGTNRCATLGSTSTHTNSALIGFTLLNGCAPLSGSYSYGGGSYCGTIEYCVISNCVASGRYAYGGGSYYGYLNNCLVAYNCATSSLYGAYGGGAYSSVMRSCTVAKNCAVGANAAYAGGTYGNSYSAYNTVIWNNEVRASNASNAYYPNTYYQYLYYCCTDGTADYRQSGCVTNDPQFVDADAGDFHLKVGSPCLNAGYNSYVRGDMDLDWDDRIQGSKVDMGCYEGAEYTAPPGQVTGLVAVRGVLAWNAMPDAEGFMIYRSTRRAASSAKYIGVSDTNAYTDETAVDGTAYYYWVQAFNTLGMGTRSDGVENTWPLLLEITTSELPEAVEMTAYSAQLAATGGTPPYSWSCPDSGYAVTTNSTSTYAEIGTPQGWHADDACWTLELPFDFPFYGDKYRTAYVNSNGMISFGERISRTSYERSIFLANPIIAVLWKDLKTTGSSDVFIASDSESVTIRWNAVYYNNGSAVNASITLYANGNVKLSYGSGNANGGFSGVSAGDGGRFVIIDNSNYSRNNTADIILLARGIPNGLSLSKDGQITGTPTASGTNTFRVVVKDAEGDTAERELSICVAENPNHKPVIDSAMPTTNIYVRVGDTATFAVTVHDPEGDALTYTWYFDGDKVDCENAQLTFMATLEDAGAHTLECVVSDGLWTAAVRQRWAFRVIRDWYVNAAADEEIGDGSSASSALRCIGDAINQAEDGDTIYVAPGTYEEGYIQLYHDTIVSVIATEGAERTFFTGDIFGNGTEWNRGRTVLQSSFSGFTFKGSNFYGVTLKNSVLTSDDTGAYGSQTEGCRLFDCAVTGNASGYSSINYCELIRCTVSGNIADAYGVVSSGCDVYDSIVWGNVTADGECANYDTSMWWDYDENGNEVEYASVQFEHSCTWPMPSPATETEMVIADPRLVDGVNGDLRLRAGSPCIVDGVQTMGVYLGVPVEGHVISVRIEGHGSVTPMTAILVDGENAVFVTEDSARPFIGFSTNGVFATANKTLTWPAVRADGIVTAAFSNFTFHVDAATGDDANDGLSWTTAKASIQSAIDSAVRGETIYVKSGRYAPIIIGDKKGLKIEGVDGKSTTIIDGGGTNSCVLVISHDDLFNTTLVGFTLTNGYSSYGGGASGGTFIDCDIVGNTAINSGGGLYYSKAIRCIIAENLVSPQQNRNGYGGGARGGTLINCLVSDNVVDGTANYGYGGGTSESVLYNCTVVGNVAHGTDYVSGGGVYAGSLYNTIVFGNSIVAEDENTSANGEDISNYLWGNCNSLVGEEPGFVDKANGDYHLVADSPCIDSGSNNYVEDDLDLDGNARIQHYTVDIGCYEYELVAPPHDADADFALQMAGTCHGLFVGVNQYTYTSSLAGCNLDATNMQARCVNRGYWDETNTVALLDASATKAAVRARLTALAGKAVSGDTVLYYQSSHGGNYTDNGVDTKDAYICLYDSRYEDYEMAEDLMQFAAGVKVVVILDTCHSAGMFKSVAASQSAIPFVKRVREIITSRRASKDAKLGITTDEIGWIAAADYDELSWDSAQGGQFTVAMLDGWASGIADYDGDKRLNFHELWRYARGIATGYGETSAQCFNEDVLLSHFAGVPDSSVSGEVTLTTPVPVDHTWLESYPEILASVGGDYEAMANAQSPGNCVGGKLWPDGSVYYLWQDFLAGTNPTNENSVFMARIEMVNGEPVIKWEPDTPELRATRVYKTFGKKTLIDKDWVDITNKDQSEYHFFKVTIDLP